MSVADALGLVFLGINIVVSLIELVLELIKNQQKK